MNNCYTVPLSGIVKELTLIREAVEIPQYVASKKIGRSQSWLGQLEKSYFQASLEDIEKLANLYGYNIRFELEEKYSDSKMSTL